MKYQNPQRSVWFISDNRGFVDEEAKKEKLTFNQMINKIIEYYRKNKKEV